MNLQRISPDAPWLQVVGPADNWVLERIARRLVAKLPYAELVAWKPRPNPATRLIYYVNYALYGGPSGHLDAAFFTHLDQEQQFLERARSVDWCVCMAKLYADWLREQGVASVTHIPMGFDFYGLRPRLTLGVFGSLEHPRKGRALVERLQRLSFVDVITTDGNLSEQELPALYQRIDYVLIPATVEGGPMSLLEGLAMGKQVIAPAGVGMVPEFDDTEHILRYPVADGDALASIVASCYQKKVRSASLVHDRTWDRWAEAHHQLFSRLLRERGDPHPEPAAGFRFGLLSELQLPQGMPVAALEESLDQVARLLYYGRYRQARAALEDLLPHYPFAEPVLASIPDDKVIAHGSCSDSREAHPKALR
jgi:hypothetical protein